MATQQPKVLPTPVDWDDLYPGRFIKATDFKGKQITLRISDVRIEELIGDKGKQVKGVISFEKTEKQWCINKTNGICVKAMFGSKVQQWVGKRVTLFAGVHNDAPCIRVWGSPDIDNDFDLVVQLPRKFPFNMTMHRTGVRPVPTQPVAATPAPEKPAEREPGADDELTLAEPFDADASRDLDLKLMDD